jgi:hypothetical protein
MWRIAAKNVVRHVVESFCSALLSFMFCLLSPHFLAYDLIFPDSRRTPSAYFQPMLSSRASVSSRIGYAAAACSFRPGSVHVSKRLFSPRVASSSFATYAHPTSSAFSLTTHDSSKQSRAHDLRRRPHRMMSTTTPPPPGQATQQSFFNSPATASSFSSTDEPTPFRDALEQLQAFPEVRE